MLFRLLPALALIFAFPGKTAAAPSTPKSLKRDLHEVYREELKLKPSSCETLYYGLFTDGKTVKTTFAGDGPVAWNGGDESAGPPEASPDQPLYEQDFLEKEFKPTFSAGVLKHPLYGDPAFRPLLSEWGSRLTRSRVVVSEGVEANGIFADAANDSGLAPRAHPDSSGGPPCDPPPSGPPLGKTYDKKDIRSLNAAQGPPVFVVGVDRPAWVSSPAAAVFWYGHEGSHLIEAAPSGSPLVECLKSGQSVHANARIPVEEIPVLPGTMIPEPGLMFDPEFLLQMRRLEEGAPDPGLQELFRQYMQKQKAPTRHGGFTSGSGTSFVRQTMEAIEEGNLTEAQNVYRVVVNAKALPLQINEAVADFNGTLAVTEFIRSSPRYKTPEQKRQAALAVLASFPPHLYQGEARKIMDSIGSKPTNETRVFRILLANPEFRSFLGCDMREPPAKDCARK